MVKLVVEVTASSASRLLHLELYPYEQYVLQDQNELCPPPQYQNQFLEQSPYKMNLSNRWSRGAASETNLVNYPLCRRYCASVTNGPPERGESTNENLLEPLIVNFGASDERNFNKQNQNTVNVQKLQPTVV